MTKSRDLANFATAGSAVSATELAFVDGVTSAIQTQLDAKALPANVINNTFVDAKGDLISATANDTPARLPVGANGETLVADSAAATGLRYQSAYNGNAIINGGYDIWQRGTSFVGATGTGTYSADRWIAYRGVAGSTFSRQNSGLTGIQYGMRAQRDSGNTSTSSIILAYNAETADSYRFAGQTITLSFYAKAGANYSPTSSILPSLVKTGTGTNQNSISGFTGEVTSSQNNTLTTSYQRFSQTISVASNVTQIALWFQPTPVGTASTNDWFEITGVQVEVGSVATTFKRSNGAGGTIQGELAACQRYYFKTFAQATAPAQNAGTTGCILVPQVVAAAVDQTVTNVRFPVTMRATPTITIFNPLAANAQFRNINNGLDWSASVATVTGDSGVGFQGTGSVASSAGDRCAFHFTAEIEL
jgi:hypothetical protein